MRCVVWLAIVLNMSLGRDDEPAPGPPQNAPLVLSPKAQSTSDHTGARTISAPLTEELARLKEEQESLRLLLNRPPSEQPGDADTSTDSAKRLRMQLDQLSSELTRKQNRPSGEMSKKPGRNRLAAPGAAKGTPSSVVSSLTDERARAAAGSLKTSDVNVKPVDPIALGQVLLRMEDYEGAVRAFRAVEFAKLRADERAYVQYLLATALRSAGQSQEALPLYREVANSKADAMIAEYARWQLSLMQWQRDLEAQLATLRERRKAIGADSAPDPHDLIESGRLEAAKESP
jgi:tetratricopeptide (TPR) repeat protein